MEFETTTETNSVKNTVEIFWLRRGVLAGQQQPGRPISGVQQYILRHWPWAWLRVNTEVVVTDSCCCCCSTPRSLVFSLSL